MRQTCSRLGCSNPVEVGAHVEVVRGDFRGLQVIVGLCLTCNHRSVTETFLLDKRSKPAHPFVQRTCGRAETGDPDLVSIPPVWSDE